MSATIASGPTIADPTTQADALAILERYRYPKLAELTPVLRDPRVRDAEARRRPSSRATPCT